VPEDVAGDPAQAGSVRVAPQVGVERPGGGGEGPSAFGPDGAAGGPSRGEDRLPSRPGQLASADSPALDAHLVARCDTARRRYDLEFRDLAPAQAGENSRHDHRPVEQPRRCVRDDRQQPRHLLGRKAPRLGATGRRAVDVERRARVNHAHPDREVVQPAHRCQAHRDGRRRRRGTVVGQAVGEAVHVEGRRSCRIADAGEEPPDGPAVRLDGPPAAAAPGLLGQEPQRDRLPRLVEGLEPNRRLEEGES
jgi:hypothetical protein